MSAGTAVLCSILLFVFVAESADQKIITAESGQDVTLTCRVPNNIDFVKWSRADLENKDLLSYKDGRFVLGNQHPSFKNRVDLQDRQMKDGDVSFILKNVTSVDNGTYECRVFMKETSSWKSISIIYLHVVPPGPPKARPVDGWMVYVVGFALPLVIVIAVVGFCTYRYRLCRGPNANQPHQTPQI